MTRRRHRPLQCRPSSERDEKQGLVVRPLMNEDWRRRTLVGKSRCPGQTWTLGSSRAGIFDQWESLEVFRYPVFLNCFWRTLQYSCSTYLTAQGKHFDHSLDVPFFRVQSVEENHRMVKAINAAEPDVLWVGMTAPKQEKWVEANRRQLTVPVIGSIGAVFDFYAGTYSRAPQWVCDIGLEWAYRFILEPRRMWRRNFVSAPKFVWLVIRQYICPGDATRTATDLSKQEEIARPSEKKAA